MRRQREDETITDQRGSHGDTTLTPSGDNAETPTIQLLYMDRERGPYQRQRGTIYETEMRQHRRIDES